MGENGGAHDLCLPKVNQFENLDYQIGYQQKHEDHISHA